MSCNEGDPFGSLTIAHGDFARTIWVPASKGECWDVLTDVQEIVRWIPVLDSVDEIERLKFYRATLRDRIGMFSLSADAEIKVTELVPESLIRFEAEGEDHQVGARIKVRAALGLDEALAGTNANVNGRYEVTGRVATLGASTIRSKAEKILDHFYTEMRASLG